MPRFALALACLLVVAADAFAQDAPTDAGGRWWVRGEYLLWWIRGDHAPVPLATTGPRMVERKAGCNDITQSTAANVMVTP